MDQETTGVNINNDANSNAESTGISDGKNHGNNDHDENDEDEDDSNDNGEVKATHNPDTWTLSVQRVFGLQLQKKRDFNHLHETVMHHAMM
jgi:hypothetical protein